MKQIILILLFFCATTLAFAQNKTVSGVVKDSQGEVVIGVSVLEKGTGNGTVTDLDGAYRLNVQAGAVLQFNYVGYTSVEITVGSATVYDIVLTENIQLEEVVIVGYGQQKKESVVGAISQLNNTELLKSPAANISQAIAGKLPGVITSQTSGAPGSDDVSIYIRGRASFAGDGQPLVMVDGVERAFSQIAPDDIETISVLKDASATAVYGVRGANGVILITTKRGSANQKPIVSLTANFQIQSPTRWDNYLDSYQSVTLLEEALANDGLPSQFSTQDLEMYRKSVAGELSGAEAMMYPNVDWYDYILNRTAPAQRYNVNIQGGTKRVRYFASGEYYNQDGLIKNFSTDQYGNSSNSSYQRYAFRANLDFLVTKDLTVSVNFGTRFEERQGANTNDFRPIFSEIYYELNHTPGWLFPVAYTIGSGEEKQTLYGGNSQNQNNIAGRLAKGGFYRQTNTINETNFIVDYKMDWLTKGLSAKAMVSFDYDSWYRRLFTADFTTYELLSYDNGVYNFAKYNTDTELAYDGDNQTTTMKVYMEYALNYVRTFGVHDVTGLLLYNQNDYRYQADLAKRYQGLVGRVTYGYDNRYLAEVNFGYNGSENFMKGRRFGFFPSFSLGWRLNNESFMETTYDWLDNLKLRVSYGEVGNDEYRVNNVLQRFLYVPVWTQRGTTYVFGNGGSQGGIYESQYPNYFVTWERAKKYNAGIEFGLFRNLLSGSVDVFTENRNDILTQRLSTPQWVGVNIAAANLGKTRNSGFEIELSHRHRIVPGLNYLVKANFTHAKNKIISMDEPEAKTDYRKEEGHPIKQYFGLVCEGFVTAADLANPNFPVSSFGNVKVGDLKYKDMNNDHFIDERDITFVGYSDIPENSYSLTLGMDWKGLAFSIMFSGVDHVSRYYDAEAQFAFINGGKVKERHLQRWNPALSENENLANAQYPLLHYDEYGSHNQRINSFFLQNGAFVRLKNIELSYTLPRRITKKWADELRFYVNANNWVTWDHLDGLIDPESNGSNKYPIMKAMNFGVNVKF